MSGKDRVRSYAEQVADKAEQMIALVCGIPEDRLRKKPAPDSWSAMEVLCHVEEALRYWREELLRVVRAGGGTWGRTLQHEGRLRAVAEADNRRPGEVIDGIRTEARATSEALLTLSDADLELEAPHVNPKFGVKPMSFLLDHFVVEHLDIHIRQIRRALDA